MENPSENVEPEMSAVVPGKKRKFPLEIRKSIVEYYDALPNDGSKAPICVATACTTRPSADGVTS